MIKGVIFDMDGLMFDTERLSTEGWIKCGEILGIDLDMGFINSFKGTAREYSGKLFKEKFGEDFDYDNARGIRTEYIKDYIDKNSMPVKKGLYELLQFLKDKGIPCAVATSTKKELAEKYFEMTDVKKFFSAFVYGDMVKRSKPEPDIFLKAAEMIGENICDCMVLEDSPVGINASHMAGATVIAVPDMIPLNNEVLNNVDFCVNNLNMVINLIEENMV